MSKQSKRKGLSLEEKRERMLQIFWDSSSFFLLKELEKKGPSKGVISQSVKDVIQSLVDDDLVFKDKIGTSVYFWSLPSYAGLKVEQEEEKVTQVLADLKLKKARLEEFVKGAQKGREAGDEREECKTQLAALQEKNRSLKEEISELSQNDPEVFEAKKRSAKIALDAANRWTDNIFSLQQWCNDNCPGGPEQMLPLYKEVGITVDLDYID